MPQDHSLRDLTGNQAVEAIELLDGDDNAQWHWNQGTPDVTRALAGAARAAGLPVSWVDRTPGELWQVEVYCTTGQADDLSDAAARAVRSCAREGEPADATV